MSRNGPEPEVACTLTEEERSERSEAVQRLLVSQYVGYEEREDGVSVRFDGTDESLRAVARFTADELRCCSFAEFNITVSPPYEETVLTVTGPEGTRRMFRDEFVERLEDEAA
ncbi:Zn-dependent oxidoreductase [Halorarum salinum]|uniref:Zn-dependent oxidoreductase n=1 Tax=Halorarum salinum TaxID=2743089 RepID=A0A7D5QG83_9EURY|nr:Zn-dependent oxidoreductase [Halobaculum salinum]QLG61882.1 Zn-dependent oxidoreductase [Halobaculum salinum]